MCGILSVYSAGSNINEDKIKDGLKTLHHRGPDHSGYWLSEAQDVVLGHTRLSIIDLSTGDQPISNADNTLHLVVNGEFYDFESIRSELQAEGYQFKTGSDSEIALHLYDKNGTSCLQHLRGEFALTLWDQRNKTLFAARDRFGINPLFYAEYQGNLYLASEIKALIAAGIPPEWDTDAYLNRDFFYGNNTLFKGIRQIPPGHFLLATGSGIEITKYWDFNYPTVADTEQHDEKESVERLRNSLLEATETRLRADVPVGVYLSGGVDSCAVLGMTSHLRDQPIDAFTLSFSDKDYDEAVIAKKMAKHVNANHHIIPVTQELLADNFSAAIWHGETFCMNAHNAGKFILSREVQKTGTVVILTGEGADEVFGGYSSFRSDLINSSSDDSTAAQQLNQLKSANKVSAGLHIASEQVSDVDFIKRNLGFEPTWMMPLAAMFKQLSHLFSSNTLHQLADSNPLKHLINRLDYNQIKDRHPVHIAMYILSKCALPNYILQNLGDRMEMANSLEGRLPFLDHKVIEQVVKLPVELKIKGGVEKYILREAVRPFVIDEVYKREKHPFLAPPSVISPGEKLYQLVQDTLRSSLLDNVPFFDKNKIISYLDDSTKQPEAQWPAIEAILLEVLSLCLLQKHYKLTV